MNENKIEHCPAILVMAKVPRTRQVKTRLRPFLNDDQCVELAICFLKDTVSKALKITKNVIVAFSPSENIREMKKFLPDGITLFEQTGNDLGERLTSAIQNVESMGFSPIITIGTDSPTLPLTILQTAVDVNNNAAHDFVLGATKDGGYYLIGLRKVIPELFKDISWSSENVFRETMEKANQMKLNNALKLPIWYDVDLPEDLVCLQKEVVADKILQKEIPETYLWLVKNQELFE